VVANRVWFGGGWTSTDWRRGPTDDDARHRVTQDSGGVIVFSRLDHPTRPTRSVRDRRSTKCAIGASKCPVWTNRRTPGAQTLLCVALGIKITGALV
jgi:hypothetical protein